MKIQRIIKLVVVLSVAGGAPPATGADVTFDTPLRLPNMSAQAEGDPVCIDSSTGELVSGCTSNNVTEICELYGVGAWLSYPEVCVPRTVFITSQIFTGALGGVSGADSKCQQAASTASLSGTFKAWVSNATEGSPSTNFTRHGMFLDTKDRVIAYGWGQLTGSDLERAITADEFGNNEPDTVVWTNTLRNGSPINTHGALGNCGLFFFDEAHLEGWVGLASQTSKAWTSVGILNCQLELGLLCFQQ